MASDTVMEALPEGTYSDGERLWRAMRGATSNFEESFAARELFMDLHRDQFWNPWRMEAQAEELKRAEVVMAEWDRAEPGFRRTTKRQMDARFARMDREAEKRRVEDEVRREANRKRYDPEREEARLALLESQCVVKNREREVAGLRSGESFPAMDAKRRAEEVEKCETAISGHKERIERLAPLVGDPEDVPDEAGRLPKDRRWWTLYLYRERRIEEVRELKAALTDIEAQLKATPTSERSARAKLRSDRDMKKSRLDKLLAVPRQEQENMCADCALPLHQHGYTTPPFVGPCPAWPGQRAIRKKVMEMLEASRRVQQPPQPVAPKPEPLAIVPSGLPINEVVERLKQLQEEFPDAEVRRGRANAWELWPPKQDRHSAE